MKSYSAVTKKTLNKFGFNTGQRTFLLVLPSPGKSTNNR